MNQQDDRLDIRSPIGRDTSSLIDALEHDAATRLGSPGPQVPGAFLGAVTRRRHARRAIGFGVTIMPLALIAFVVSMFWRSPVPTSVVPEVVGNPSKREVISPAPTAAELARVNRGRSGDALVLPEAGGAGGETITAGTRPDSPAAAQIVK